MNTQDQQSADQQPDDQRLAVERAHRILRAHTTGTLLIDSLPYDMTYIIDPHTGSLVLTLEEDMLEGDDIVLVVPEDRFDAPMRLSIDLSTYINEEPCDRFIAYHLNQPSPIWARGQINFAKLECGAVVGNDELGVPNPLIQSLSSLCKKLNNDRKALHDVCLLLTKADIEDPIAVGVDPIGFDVRSRFGIVRVEFPGSVENATQAEDVIAALIGGVS